MWLSLKKKKKKHLHWEERGKHFFTESLPLLVRESHVSILPMCKWRAASSCRQRSSERDDRRSVWLSRQEAGPNLQGTGFCCSAWSKRWGHRDFEIHERLQHDQGHEEASLGKEIHFHLVQSAWFHLACKKSHPWQLPSFPKEENSKLQTYTSVIYLWGNLASLRNCYAHVRTHTHTQAHTLCYTAPKDVIHNPIHGILQSHEAIYGGPTQYFSWIFPPTVIQVESTFKQKKSSPGGIISHH